MVSCLSGTKIKTDQICHTGSCGWILPANLSGGIAHGLMGGKVFQDLSIWLTVCFSAYLTDLILGQWSMTAIFWQATRFAVFPPCGRGYQNFSKSIFWLVDDKPTKSNGIYSLPPSQWLVLPSRLEFYRRTRQVHISITVPSNPGNRNAGS